MVRQSLRSSPSTETLAKKISVNVFPEIFEQFSEQIFLTSQNNYEKTKTCY